MNQPLVLHTITELNYGGAEQLLVNVLRYVLAQPTSQFRHQVVTLYDGQTPLSQELRALGVPVHDLQMKKSEHGRVTAPYQFWRLLRQEKPAIIHNWLYHASLLGRTMGRLAQTPVIITARHTSQFGIPLRTRLYNWTGRLDDRTILICEAMRSTEQGAPERYITIYNGIPSLSLPPRETARAKLLAELGLPDTAVFILTIGRLHPAKGHRDTIPALRQLRTSHPHAHFLWVGDGEEYAHLAAQIAEANLTSHVHLLGKQPDIAPFLASADIFLLPSRWEGVPVAIQEAMAAGLPVVSTAVGGIPELVQDGQTGLLVPPQDPTALAQALITLLNDHGRATQMGQAGRQRIADHFTIEQMVTQTEALYERLLQEKLGMNFRDTV